MLLLDRDDFPRDKACGDGIAPHAVDVLAGLGVHGLTDGYAPVHRLELGRPAGPAVAGDMARPAHVVPRAVLDERMVRAAVERGAELRRHRVRTVERHGEDVVLDGSIRARVVVAADGAGSVLRRAVGRSAHARRRTAVAIRGYAPVSAERAGAQVITFAPTSWPAYAWSFPVGDGTANVGYGEVLSSGRELTRADLLQRLDRCCPARATARSGGGRTCSRSARAAPVSPTDGCCWPATPPG